MDTDVEAVEPEKNTDTISLYKLRFHNQLTYQQISDITGLAPQTIHDRLKRFTDKLPDPADYRVWKEHRAQLLDQAVFTLVQHGTDKAKLKKGSLNNTWFSARQAYEMHRLETGQSTQNINSLTALITQSHQTSLKKLGSNDTKPNDSDPSK